MSDNIADYGGGGAYGCTLFDCVVSSNTCKGVNYAGGGGVCNCTLYNCFVTSNNASGFGGGGASSRPCGIVCCRATPQVRGAVPMLAFWLTAW
ncbi:hypothetical protein SBV1_1120015 [Verrucomicrobia bacterium]|nr:hypothetical protein SBV1_1120015 [Verrucomicrobiota bacterium]